MLIANVNMYVCLYEKPLFSEGMPIFYGHFTFNINTDGLEGFLFLFIVYFDHVFYRAI